MVASGTKRGLGSLPPTHPLPPPGRSQGALHTLMLPRGESSCQRGKSHILGTKADKDVIPSTLLGALALPGGRGILQASLPHLHVSTSLPLHGVGTVPGSPFCPRPSTAKGFSQRQGTPALWGLHGGGPTLESRGKIGAGSELNSRVPGQARLTHPGAKEGTLAGALGTRLRNSWRVGMGSGQP